MGFWSASGGLRDISRSLKGFHGASGSFKRFHELTRMTQKGFMGSPWLSRGPQRISRGTWRSQRSFRGYKSDSIIGSKVLKLLTNMYI